MVYVFLFIILELHFVVHYMARMDCARGDGAEVLAAGWYCDAARRRDDTLGEWVGDDDAEREVAGGGATAA